MTYLTCTCTHRRKLHEGGKDSIRDKYVFRCTDPSCQCTKYTANEKSKKKPYYNKIFLRVLGIILGGLIVSLTVYAITTFTIAGFDIQLLNKTETYIDGELQPAVFTPKEGLIFSLNTFLIGLVVIIFYIWGIFYIDEYSDSELRKFYFGEDEV